MKSARPCSIAATAAWADGTDRHTIASGLPSGWAACDHSRKNGLRAKRICVLSRATIL